MSCGPTYGQFIAWLHAAGLLPPGEDAIVATSGVNNVAGVAIPAGKLVYVSGWDNVNNCQMVALADPSDLLTCATYIATTTVPAGLVASSIGRVAKQGTITGLALVAAIGDNARLAAAGGGNVQAGTAGLLASNICQQEVGHFVTAGTSVYVDLSAAPIHRIGTSELQGNCVTAAKADLTANWAWTAASPQITLGNNAVAAGLALRDGSSANAGTVAVTTLTGARTYTFPNATGNVPVTAGAMVSLPQASYSNTNPANIRFGDVGIAPSASSVTVTVTGVPDTSAASGSVVFVQFNGLAAAPGPVAWPGAFVLRAVISGGTLTISLLNAATGAALAMGAATAMSLSYVILY